MEEQNQMAEMQTETSTPEVAPTEEVVNTPEQTPQERMYTKDEVVELMKKRVDRSHKSFFDRYGVENLEGLDNIFNEHNSIKENYTNLQTKHDELLRENAFLRNNINPEKYSDIIAFFKGSNIEFSEQALIEALANHPEWLKQQELPKTTIRSLGSEGHIRSELDEKALASKLLGVKL